MTDAARRAALVAHAGQVIARGSRSFAAASRLFDRTTRERAWLLYAWCRICDDIADNQVLGREQAKVSDPAARIASIRAQTQAALEGRAVDDMAFEGLRVVVTETGIPQRFIDDVIAGFALDADDWRPRSEADMLRYCYHVAGAVGCMMAVVMGVDPKDGAVLDRACDLGIAFQLANIARDVEEDDRSGRCYLPVEWLVEMDIPPGQHMKPPYRDRLVVLVRRLAAMAGRYEASARAGAGALPFRARWAVLSAAGIYGDIARKVAALGAHAWDHRVHTGNVEKLGRAARALHASIAAPNPVTREGLWSRPAI